jgi:uncharacterized membrane protein (DUF106 family)
MLSGRTVGRLPDREVMAFHPTYRLKRWIFWYMIAVVSVGYLICKVVAR